MSKITSIIVIVIVAALGYLVITKGPRPASDQAITTNQNTTMSTVEAKTTKEGAGEGVQSGQTATVKYKGMLTDGSTFDEGTIDFKLGEGRVIQGWEQGILGMKVGEARTLTIPPELGYGAGGYPPVIPANATLIFEVELLAIQ